MCSDLFRDRKLSGNLLGSWCFHCWFSVSHAAGFALFVQIVKEGEELIVLTLREWIELVIVAAGTTERNPEQDGRCRVNTICNVFNAVFLGDNSPFRIDYVISVETRCDPLVERWFGQQIASELLRHKLIERDSLVQRIDCPVTPAPHVTSGIIVETMRVRITSRVEPVDRHTLPIAR